MNPVEIHINDLGFLDTIYLPVKRDKEVRGSYLSPSSQSVGRAKTHQLHRIRREPLNPLFTKSSILKLEPMFTEKADGIRRILSSYIGQSKPLNLNDIYFAFTME